MLIAEQFAFSNVLKFHHNVLKEIESGRSTWNSNFDSMRARRLIDRVPRQYCGAYNKAICKKKEGHFNCYGVVVETVGQNERLLPFIPQKDCKVMGIQNFKKGDKDKDVVSSPCDFKTYQHRIGSWTTVHFGLCHNVSNILSNILVTQIIKAWQILVTHVSELYMKQCCSLVFLTIKTVD